MELTTALSREKPVKHPRRSRRKLVGSCSQRLSVYVVLQGRNRIAAHARMQGSTVDTVHQSLACIMMIMCPEHVSSITVGELSNHTYALCRNLT